MKKTKRIASYFATMAIFAACISSALSASAAEEQKKTYRVYFDSKAGYHIKNAVYQFDLGDQIKHTGYDYVADHGVFSYSSGYYEGLGELNVSISAYNTINQSLSLFYLVFETPMTTMNLFNEISYTSTVKNTSGDLIPNNAIVLNSILVGDVDFNGRVDSTDAMLVLQHTTGNTSLVGDAFLAADADGDGTVTAEDANMILNYALGNISSLG